MNPSFDNSSKPNVLLLLNSFETGGAEGQLVLLARLLIESGDYRVHFACLGRTGPLLVEAEKLGVGDIPEFPLTSFYDRNMVKQLRRFRSFLRERKIDVVHTDGFYTNVFGIIGAKLAGVPARIGFRGETGGRRPAQNSLERAAFRLASVVHANSVAVKTFLVEEGVPAQRIQVVYNGLDVTRVTPPAALSRDEALGILDLPRDGARRFVAIVANLHKPVKNYPMFLKAAARVRAQVPEAAFVIAGEGELMEDMRALARDLRIEQDVFFIGRCNRVAELLFASDLCVLSSRAEGFSNSILEYMGAARPVVATNVGGAREAIIEGETGHLVASGDHETMAARIVDLLRNPEKAKAMGERGRLIVEQKFSTRVQLERTAELYETTLSRIPVGEISRGVVASPERAL